MLLVMAAGVSLAASYDDALYLLAPAVIAFTLLAIVNSWNLTLVGSSGDGGTSVTPIGTAASRMALCATLSMP